MASIDVLAPTHEGRACSLEVSVLDKLCTASVDSLGIADELHSNKNWKIGSVPTVEESHEVIQAKK
jgi:hypothetical protein